MTEFQCMRLLTQQMLVLTVLSNCFRKLKIKAKFLKYESCKIIPLHKWIRKDIINYRPISNLCSMAALRKNNAIYKRNWTIKTKNIPGNNQFGFKNHSTEKLGLLLQSKITKTLAGGKLCEWSPWSHSSFWRRRPQYTFRKMSQNGAWWTPNRPTKAAQKPISLCWSWSSYPWPLL